jgi:indoleamine 2,3-dioxygenase
MNVIDLFPAPHQYFSLAVSLFQTTVTNQCWKPLPEKRRSPVDFDIDVNTGFFPRQPLTRLPSAYAAWEVALSEAAEQLSLGEDDSDEAIAKRASGELWRSRVRSVSEFSRSVFRLLTLLYSGQ